MKDADHESPDFNLGDRQADRPGNPFVVLDRVKGKSQPGTSQKPEKEHANRHPEINQGHGCPYGSPIPLGSAQRLIDIEKVADHFAEPESGQNDINTAKAQRGNADDYSGEHRNQGPRHEGRFQRPVQLDG